MVCVLDKDPLGIQWLSGLYVVLGQLHVGCVDFSLYI